MQLMTEQELVFLDISSPETQDEVLLTDEEIVSQVHDHYCRAGAREQRRIQRVLLDELGIGAVAALDGNVYLMLSSLSRSSLIEFL